MVSRNAQQPACLQMAIAKCYGPKNMCPMFPFRVIPGTGRFGRSIGLGVLWSVLLAQSSAAQPRDPRSGQDEEPSNEVRISAPVLASPGDVPYPEGASGKAVVALKILVQVDGGVGDVQVVEGEEPFASAAIEAARGFVFTPATADGEPRAAWILYRIEYLPPVIETLPVPEPKRPPASDDGAREDVQEEAEVVVEGVRRPGVGRVMSDAETQIIPGAEGDPLRSIEAMPGTVPILASGPFLGLRGASPGMVGYEFDGISLPFLFHLARGPAVVHPWMVASAAIHHGGAPARLGRAAGGFVEATAAPPESRYRGSYRLRATDAALGAEAPLDNGNGTFLAAGRYSYTKPLVSLIAPEFALNYWDYQTRLRYRLSPQDEISLLTFGAGDRSSVILEGQPRDDLFYGSLHRASLRYTRYREGGGNHRLAFTVGHDRWDGQNLPIRPRLSTVHVAGTWSEPLSQRSWLELGADLGTRFQTEFWFPEPDDEDRVEKYHRNDVMAGAWVDWTFAPTDVTTMALGVRFDLYNSDRTPRDDAATHGVAQPRFSLSHQATDVIRLHNSLGVAAQPRSPAQRPPGRVYSVDGGLEHAVLSDAGVELSLPGRVSFDTTVFHNTFFNVGDVEHLRFIREQDRSLERGRGQAYGLEVSLRRMLAARLRGFISYTLSRSWRSLGRVKGLAEFDRPHVVDVALAYDFGRGWSLSSRGTYYRGYPARMGRAQDVEDAPRATDHYQIDAQAAKRWDVGTDGAWWGITMGVLNANLRSEANFFVCDPALRCEEELVGPATIPTFGIEGEL